MSCAIRRKRAKACWSAYQEGNTTAFVATLAATCRDLCIVPGIWLSYAYDNPCTADLVRFEGLRPTSLFWFLFMRTRFYKLAWEFRPPCGFGSSQILLFWIFSWSCGQLYYSSHPWFQMILWYPWHRITESGKKKVRTRCCSTSESVFSHVVESSTFSRLENLRLIRDGHDEPLRCYAQLRESRISFVGSSIVPWLHSVRVVPKLFNFRTSVTPLPLARSFSGRYNCYTFLSFLLKRIIKRFAQRHMYLGIDAIADRDLGFAKGANKWGRHLQHEEQIEIERHVGKGLLLVVVRFRHLLLRLGIEMIVLELENHYHHHAHKREKNKNLDKFQFLPSYRGSSEIYPLLLPLMVNFLSYSIFWRRGDEIR